MACLLVLLYTFSCMTFMNNFVIDTDYLYTSLQGQFCFVLSALLGNLTKYCRDMKYTKLNKQRPKRKKKQD